MLPALIKRENAPKPTASVRLTSQEIPFELCNIWGAKLHPAANVVRLVYGHLPGTPPIGAFLRDGVVSEMRTLLGLGQEPQDAAIILSFSGQACAFG